MIDVMLITIRVHTLMNVHTRPGGRSEFFDISIIVP